MKFIRDQRNKVGHLGQYQISTVTDEVETKRIKRKQERVESKVKTSTKIEEHPCTAEISNEVCDMEIFDDHSKDPDYLPIHDINKNPSNQQRVDLSLVGLEAIRYNVSSRAAAALHNATLRAYDLITENDNHLVADKNKIDRAKESCRRKQTQKQKAEINTKPSIQCIGTDGKKNKKTKVFEIHVSK